MSKPKPTHVFLEPCIVDPIGSVKAGQEIAQKEVEPNTWTNLQQRGIIKSIADLKAEADAKDAEAEQGKLADNNKKLDPA